MKIAIFNNDQLGIVLVEENKIVDVSRAANWDTKKTSDSFQYLIENFDELKPQIEQEITEGKSYNLSDVFLKSPFSLYRILW